MCVGYMRSPFLDFSCFGLLLVCQVVSAEPGNVALHVSYCGDYAAVQTFERRFPAEQKIDHPAKNVDEIPFKAIKDYGEWYPGIPDSESSCVYERHKTSVGYTAGDVIFCEEQLEMRSIAKAVLEEYNSELRKLMISKGIYGCGG